jgi:succinate-semialdehyde dehydrogenase/glutarate-semialdehyde dehydrogenase
MFHVKHPLAKDTPMTAYPTLKLFITGQWIANGEAGQKAVVNPATGDVIGDCRKASPAQLDAALKAAGDAFSAWSQTPGAERHAILRHAADLLRQRAPAIASVIIAYAIIPASPGLIA